MDEQQLYLGKRYDSFQSFEQDLRKYSDANFVQFYKRESRKLGCTKYKERLSKLKPRSELVYYSITYCCVRSKHRNKKSRIDENNRKRKHGSVRGKCEASIRLGLSDENNPCRLEIKAIFLLHNHPVTESDYKLHPAQRKLQPRAQAFALDMLRRGVSKEAILLTVKNTFGQDLLKKDLYNLAHRYGISAICFTKENRKRHRERRKWENAKKEGKKTSVVAKEKSEKHYSWDTELTQEAVAEIDSAQEVLTATQSIAIKKKIEDVEDHNPEKKEKEKHKPERKEKEKRKPIEKVLAHTSLEQVLMPNLNVEIMETFLVQKLKQQVLEQKPLEPVLAAELSAVELNESYDKKFKTISILTGKFNHMLANLSDELFEKRIACLETLFRLWTKNENDVERIDGRSNASAHRLRPNSVFLKDTS